MSESETDTESGGTSNDTEDREEPKQEPETETETEARRWVEAPNYDHAFDAIVVGAGLAGSAAAVTMADEGLDVLLIERGRYPGAKNVFGGVLYTPTLRELVDVTSAPVERYVAEKQFSMLTDDDETALTFRPGEWHDPPHNDSYTVLRGEFDRWFAEQAIDAGAVLVTETTVTDLLREGDRIVGVETDRPDGTIAADYVVLAEGGNTLVSEEADLRKPERAENIAVGVKEVLEFPERDGIIEDRFRLSNDAGAAYHYFGSGAVGEAFGGGFIYTNEDTISVGLAYRLTDAAGRQPKPEQTLNAFKSHPAIAPLVRGARTVEYGAKTIPEGGHEAIPQLVYDGAAVVGDAAGLVLNNGVHLEGTNMAIESGYLAGETIADAAHQGRTEEAALREYPERLEESFVVRNLKRYEWLMNRAEDDRELLFEQLPEALADAGTEYFRIDREPKARHAEEAKDELLEAVGGWRGAAKLAFRYRQVIR